MMRILSKNTANDPGALRILRWPLRVARREEGGSLVEMALVCAFVYLPMLFGIFQVSYGLFVYNYVCDVAHQATRYAAVRGSNSCVIQGNFVDCNLSPAGSSNSTPASSSGSTTLQNYVQNMNFMGIDINKLTVTANWYTESFAGSGGFSVGSWSTTPCTSTVINNTCNDIGNAVQVQVVYQFPLNIPFWKNKTLPITARSQMMISE
jgi:Flp pilus assembly protein TadG